ncbi:hypothetical protein CXB51_005426 [Gossypium anomalum]|uniref:Uncharacterized protein n=1 Tax=Gossypium anomalum TaxID=47600 RepID=A0A8J5ZHT9_9ROSI|nr:hypothetical protein CXB51_005426 [Gossypium anomalum]
MMCKGDDTSVYTVKSGYKCLIKNDLLNIEANLTIHQADLKAYYTKMWKLKLSNKIKIGIFLPTLHNLKKRGLSDEESMARLFRDCNFTNKVLQELGVANSTINRN